MALTWRVNIPKTPQINNEYVTGVFRVIFWNRKKGACEWAVVMNSSNLSHNTVFACTWHLTTQKLKSIYRCCRQNLHANYILKIEKCSECIPACRIIKASWLKTQRPLGTPGSPAAINQTTPFTFARWVEMSPLAEPDGVWLLEGTPNLLSVFFLQGSCSIEFLLKCREKNMSISCHQKFESC